MKKTKKLVFICFVFLTILSCSNLNDNQPDYIKDLVMYSEGSDGKIIYFILADQSGAMTTSDGFLNLIITGKDQYGSDRKMLHLGLDVQKKHFQKTKIGIGAFARDAIVYSFGRIPYSHFDYVPNTTTIVKMSLMFRTKNGNVLQSNKEHVF